MAKSAGGIRSTRPANTGITAPGGMTQDDFNRVASGFLGPWLDVPSFEAAGYGKTLGLNENEVRLIYSYTAQMYQPLNGELYDGNPEAKFAASMLNAALAKVPSYKGVVYHGQTETDGMKLLERLESMGEFKSDAFISSSAKYKTAKAFTSQEAGVNVVYRITSKTGRELKYLSNVPKEREVLFRAGTKFKYEGKRWSRNKKALVINISEI